jgi:hypothetical protein
MYNESGLSGALFQPKPILRPVKPEEATDMSPWPNRLAGVVSWHKPERSLDQIHAEYEGGWYSHLQKEWNAFRAGLSAHQLHPGTAMSFFNDVRRANNATMKNSPQVYGHVDLEASLLSLDDRLYAGDINLFEVLFRAFVVERVAQARCQKRFESVLEIGCGSGVNLFNLYNQLCLRSVGGCDLSQSAIRFLQQVSADLGVHGRFEAGDYCDVETIRLLMPTEGMWALLSVHTIEQTRSLPPSWFDSIVSFPNPPQIVMHFEPMQWTDDTTFSRSCARYAELNRYNRTFLSDLHKAEENGSIRVIWTERRVIGHSAYNPTSVAMWIPREKGETRGKASALRVDTA